MQETDYMRSDTLKWNNHTFKQLSKVAKLIFCFLETHCSTDYFLQANKSDIASDIGQGHRSGLKSFGNVVDLALKRIESGFIVRGSYDS